MKLKVIVHEVKSGGYWAEIPSIPGCVAEGETVEEVIANLREEIEVHFDIDVEHLVDRSGGQLLEVAV